MKHIHLAFIAATLGLGATSAGLVATSAPAGAQQAPPDATQVAPYVDESCGTWVNDAWVPNGKCSPESDRLRHDSVAGTITAVQGHLVTIQETARTLVINDQPALDHQRTGKVAVGRQVVCYGYWLSGTFYASAIY